MEDSGQRTRMALDTNFYTPNAILPVESYQQTDNYETVQPASLGSQSENTDSVNTVFDKRILNKQKNCSEPSSIKHHSDHPNVCQAGISRDGIYSGVKKPNFIVGGLINSRTVKGQKMQVTVNEKISDYKIHLDSELGPTSFDEHCHDLMSRECHDIMTKECHIPPMTLVSEQELSLLSMASVESTHPPDTSDRGTSPSVLSVSSATSSKRLEWDSAADIGYQGANASSTSLSTLERITIGNYASSIALNDPDTQGDYQNSKKKGKFSKPTNYFRKALPEFGQKTEISDGRRGHKTGLQNWLFLTEQSPAASKGNRLKKAKPPSLRACTSDEEGQSIRKVSQSPRRRLRKRSSLHNLDKENRKFKPEQCSHAPHHLQEKSLSDRYSQSKKSCSLNELNNISMTTKDNKQSISQIDLVCFENQSIGSRMENEITKRNVPSVDYSVVGENYETSDLTINTTSGTLVQSSLSVPDSPGNSLDAGNINSKKKLEDDTGLNSFIKQDSFVNKRPREHSKVRPQFAKSYSSPNDASMSPHPLSIAESKHQWDVWNLDHAKKLARGFGNLDGELAITPGGATPNSSLDQSSFICDLTQHPFKTPSQLEKQLKPDDMTAAKSLPKTSMEEAVVLVDLIQNSSNYSSVELEDFSFHFELGAMADKLTPSKSKLVEKADGTSGSKKLQPLAETGTVVIHNTKENQEELEKVPEIAVVNKILFNLSIKLGKFLQSLPNKQSDSFSSGQFEKLNSYVKFIGTDSSNSKEIELKQEVAELIVDVVGELSSKHECSALQKHSIRDFMDQTSDLLGTNSFAQTSPSINMNINALQRSSVLPGIGTLTSSASLSCLQGSKQSLSMHQVVDEGSSAHSNNPSAEFAAGIITLQNRQPSSPSMTTGSHSGASTNEMIIPTTSETERSVTPVGREDVVAYQPPSSDQVYYMAVSAECAYQPWSLRTTRGPLAAISSTGPQSLPPLRTTSRQQEEVVLQRRRTTRVAAHQPAPASGEHSAGNDLHNFSTGTTNNEAGFKQKMSRGQAEKVPNKVDKPISQHSAFNEARQSAVSGDQTLDELGKKCSRKEMANERQIPSYERADGRGEKTMNEEVKKLAEKEIGRGTESIQRKEVEELAAKENKNREAVKKLAENEVLAAVEIASKRVIDTNRTRGEHMSIKCSDESFRSRKFLASNAVNSVLEKSYPTTTVANTRKESERIMARENLSESLRALTLEPTDDGSAQELQSCVFVVPSQSHDANLDAISVGVNEFVSSHHHETGQECLFESLHESSTRGLICSSLQQLAPQNTTTQSVLSMSSLNLGSSCGGYSVSVSSVRSSSQHSACSCSPLRSGSPVAPERQFRIAKDTNSSEEEVAGLTSKVNYSSSLEGEIVSIMRETGVSNRDPIVGASRRDFANDGRVDSSKGTTCREGSHNNDGINTNVQEKNLRSASYQNGQGHHVENLDQFNVPINEDASRANQPSDYTQHPFSCSIVEAVQEGVCMSVQGVSSRRASEQVLESSVTAGDVELITTFPIGKFSASPSSDPRSCWPTSEVVPISHNNVIGSDLRWHNSSIPVSREDDPALHGRFPGAAPSHGAVAVYRPADGAEGGALHQERPAWSSSCSESAYETIRSKDRRLDEEVASSFEFYCTTSKDARAVGYTSSVDEVSRPADPASDSPRERLPLRQPVAGQPTHETRRKPVAGQPTHEARGTTGVIRSAVRAPPHAINTKEAAQSSTSSDRPAEGADSGRSIQQRRRHLRKIQRYISTLERLEKTLAAGTGSGTTSGWVPKHLESSRRNKSSSINPDTLGRTKDDRIELRVIDPLNTTTTTDGGNSTGNSSGITRMEREVRKLEKLQHQIQEERAAAGVVVSAEVVHKNNRDERDASGGRCSAFSVETNPLLVGELTKLRLEYEESRCDASSFDREHDSQMFEEKQISDERKGMDIPLSARAVDYIRRGVDASHPFTSDANNLPTWVTANHPSIGDVSEQYTSHNNGEAYLRQEVDRVSEASPVGDGEARHYQLLLMPSSSSSDMFNDNCSELKQMATTDSEPFSSQAVDSIDFQSHNMIPDAEHLKASTALGPAMKSAQGIKLSLATGAEVQTDILQNLMMESSFPLMTSTVRGTSGRPLHYTALKSLCPENVIGTIDTNRTLDSCSGYGAATYAKNLIGSFPSDTVTHQNDDAASFVYTAAEVSSSNVYNVTTMTGPTSDTISQTNVTEPVQRSQLNTLTYNNDRVVATASCGQEQQVGEDKTIIAGRARRPTDLGARKPHASDPHSLLGVSTRADAVPLTESVSRHKLGILDHDKFGAKCHLSKERIVKETKIASNRNCPSRKKPEFAPVYANSAFERETSSFHHDRLVDHVHHGNSFTKELSLTTDRQERLGYQKSVAVQTGDSLLSSYHQQRSRTAVVPTRRAELRDVSSQCTRDASRIDELNATSRSTRGESCTDGQGVFKVNDEGCEKLSENPMGLDAWQGSSYAKANGPNGEALSIKNYSDKENINIVSREGIGVGGNRSSRRNNNLLQPSLVDASPSTKGRRPPRKQVRNTPRSFQSSGSEFERLGSAAQQWRLKSKLDAKFGVAVTRLELPSDGGDDSRELFCGGLSERSPRTLTESNARNDQPSSSGSRMLSKGFLSHTAKRLEDRERNKANRTLVSDQSETSSSSRRPSRANQSEDGSSSAVLSLPSSGRLWQPLGRGTKTGQSGARNGDKQRGHAAPADQASTELTLQEALLLSKPQFVAAAEERRARIARHQSLRREAQRYNAHLITSLPPALHTPRTLQSLMYRPAVSPVVPYRELRAQNRRLVTRLPEARRANRQRERQALARANRIRRELYSQRLCSKAIIGEVAHGHRDVLTPSIS